MLEGLVAFCEDHSKRTHHETYHPRYLFGHDHPLLQPGKAGKPRTLIAR